MNRREDRSTTDPIHVSRRRFLQGSAAAVAAASLPIVRAGTAAAGASCDPLTTPPSFMGSVPDPSSVLGFAVGVDREATYDEIVTYLNTVGPASNRVVVGDAGASELGRGVRYAIVGNPANVTGGGLSAIQQAMAQLRDPSTPQATVDTLATSTPAILWIVGNLHGGEESGGDASLQLLYELADRDDCGVTDILDRAIVVIIPSQNPDGRESDFRRNRFSFDLNQDHLVRTQSETEGKLDLMAQYPPVVLTDHHEFGYYRSFFPPNDDPVYHETPEHVVRQINDVFGPAFARAFRSRDWPFFNEGYGYDLFAPRFTDTFAVMAYGAAGMTIEVYDGAPLDLRFQRHLTVMWSMLATAAANRRKLLRQLHDTYVTALDEGRRGVLEPNRTYEPHSRPVRPVDDRKVRHYFIEDDPTQGARDREAPPASPADGRRGAPAERAAPRARSPTVPRGRASGNRAGRLVLDPDGAATEAVHPGGAERGSLQPDELGVPRELVEPAARLQPRRLPVGRQAGARRRSRRRRSPSPALPRCRGTLPRVAHPPPVPRLHRVRGDRAHALAVPAAVGPRRSPRSTPTRSSGRSTTSTCSSCPRAASTRASASSARPGSAS